MIQNLVQKKALCIFSHSKQKKTQKKHNSSKDTQKMCTIGNTTGILVI